MPIRSVHMEQKISLKKNSQLTNATWGPGVIIQLEAPIIYLQPQSVPIIRIDTYLFKDPLLEAGANIICISVSEENFINVTEVSYVDF